MLDIAIRNVVRAQMLAQPLFARPEISTGGNVSMIHRENENPQILILTGYSSTPVYGDAGTVVFPMNYELFTTIAWPQVADELPAVAPAQATGGAVPLRDRLNRVKAAFGISSKELAAVLQCSRAALYNWLDEAYPGQVREDTLARLAVLERLAERWNGYEAGNLAAHLHASIVEHADGQRGDLFSLLTQEVIDEDRVAAALRSIATLSRQQVAEFRRVNDLMARGFGQ
ncbi:hypothetical protein AB4Y32_39945 [Paraburkholderia phymatum]|uniref:Uncharacterized protein n=1 Tax=Paraburkholderia phymatum TaxID=148447 RepID=A0ACC6UE33_9BURK